MKKYLYILAALLITSTGCSDDNEAKMPEPEATGTVTIDGETYGWVRYDHLDWMTSNFKGGTPYDENYINDYGDPIYTQVDDEQAELDFETYGNQLNYEEAVACCPEGWRLPTDDDWQRLERAFGMSASQAASSGWRGNHEGELMQQEGGIHLLLGGQCSMSAGNYNSIYWRNVRESGYYWSSTPDPSYTTSPAVFYRRIRAHSGQIERHSVAIQETDHTNDKSDRYMSVRYVRDASN